MGKLVRGLKPLRGCMAINPKDIWKTGDLDKQCKLNKTILKIKAHQHIESQTGIELKEYWCIKKYHFYLRMRSTKNDFTYCMIFFI